MKKKFLFLMALLAVSLLALAKMTVYVYKNDGTRVEYIAADVDSIGFVNMLTITFDANGGNGSMDAVQVKEGKSFMLPGNTFAQDILVFANWNTKEDGSGIVYDDKASVTTYTNLTLYAQWEYPKGMGIADGHEWIDLGLPSGTKWATKNLGATEPKEDGSHYAWGETSTKDKFNESTYKWFDINYDYTKYCMTDDYGLVDNRTILELPDDVAYRKWGSSWRMPTKEEVEELINREYTSWEDHNDYYTITSKINGNSIILPCPGYRKDGWVQMSDYPFYWTSSLYTEDSHYAYILYDGKLSYKSRVQGCSVRPVLREAIIKYDVIFDSNEGEGTMPSITIGQDEEFTVPKNDFSRNDYEFICWNTQPDGTGLSYGVGSKIIINSGFTLYAQWAKNNSHEWVDLGLPSGIKWATCNIGATAPEEYGYHFAWGEIYTKLSYTKINYTYRSNNLLSSASAASVYWGSPWRFPTGNEIEELCDKCTWTWTTQNEVEGYIVTGPNGNSIFMPAAGSRVGSDLSGAGSKGCYWGSTVTKYSAWHSQTNSYTYSYKASYLFFREGSHSDTSTSSLYVGYTVRPVRK